MNECFGRANAIIEFCVISCKFDNVLKKFMFSNQDFKTYTFQVSLAWFSSIDVVSA
jgi:hypothetical protein